MKESTLLQPLKEEQLQNIKGGLDLGPSFSQIFRSFYRGIMYGLFNETESVLYK
ncbi:hypothetical protein [Algivirga pacifica]|uniref:hypothetical protein n=1 Tax=Algivirga pacifica TaxID=1162670 RepID=UPI0031EB8BC0